MAVTNKARRAKEATDDLDGKREEATEAAKERLEDAGDAGGKASEIGRRRGAGGDRHGEGHGEERLAGRHEAGRDRGP